MSTLRNCLAGVLVIAMLMCALPVARIGAQASSPYIVQAGDSLTRIAARLGVTVDAIVQANGLTNPDAIWVGQELVIPGGSTSSSPPADAGGTYVVRWGDTLSGIALRAGVSLWALLQANGLTSSQLIYVGQKLVIPGLASATPAPSDTQVDSYVVRPGDSLSRIAQRFGISTFTLARLNNITNSSLIFAGQVLRISDASSGSDATVPSASGAKRIVVDLSQQHLYAYAGEQLVYSFVCSSGVAPYYTRTGTFAVQSKIPNAYGGTWGIWMPYWLGIYWAGGTENGIHALPIMQNGQTLWSGYLGRPVSYGCIVLGTYNAHLLYDWVDMGTPVLIQS